MSNEKMTIIERKRVDADAYRTLIEVMEKAVNKTLKAFDGKVLNKKFFDALAEETDAVFGTYSPYEGRVVSKIRYTQKGVDEKAVTNESGEYDYAEVEIHNNPIIQKMGYSYFNGHTSFNICLKRQGFGKMPRIAYEETITDTGAGWNLPNLADKIRLLKVEIGKLESCTEDKIALCKAKLAKLSQLIQDEFGGMEMINGEPHSKDSYFYFNGIVGMREAVADIRDSWPFPKEYLALKQLLCALEKLR